MNEYFQFCRLRTRQSDAAVREELKPNTNLHISMITCRYLQYVFPCCDTKFGVVFGTAEGISRSTRIFYGYVVLLPH